MDRPSYCIVTALGGKIPDWPLTRLTQLLYSEPVPRKLVCNGVVTVSRNSLECRSITGGAY